MAKPHISVSILPGYFPPLHKRHARCRHTGLFTFLSTRHRLLRGIWWHHSRDEEGTILALRQRDRVRRIRLDMSVADLWKFIRVIDEEYSMLEYLIIWTRVNDSSKVLMLPGALQAPHLRHLALVGFTLPVESRLLTSAVRLVTLFLFMSNPSTYFHPNTLLQWLSNMPQLETLIIFAVPYDDVQMQFTHPPAMILVTLPNFHYFLFLGHSPYMEALVHRITPCPEKLEIYLCDESTAFFPRLVQFMNTAENIKFEGVKFKFFDCRVSVVVYSSSRAETEMSALSMTVSVSSWEFDWLVSYVAQISNSFCHIFSVVERLTLECENEDSWTEGPGVEHYWFNRIEWRQLFRSFGNVKTLRIDNGLVEGVSRSLESDYGEPPLGLLPELQELAYSRSGKTGDGFTSFIDARQKAGRPVTLTCY